MTKTVWQRFDEIALILIAVSLPLSIAATNIALTIGVILLVRRCIVDRSLLKALGGGITLPLIIWLGVSFISMLFSGYPIRVSNFIEEKWVISAYFVGFGLVHSSRSIRQTTLAWLIAGGILAIYAIYQFIFGHDLLRHEQLEPIGGMFMAIGLFGHHLTYGGVAMALLLMASAGIKYIDSDRARQFIIALATLNGIGLLASYARSAIIGAAAGAAVLTMLLQRRYLKYLVAVGVVGMILMLLFMPGMGERFSNVFSGEESPRIRLALTSLNIIKHHPIIGIGEDNFSLAFEEYHVPGFYASTAHPHNDFLSATVNGGIIGLAAFAFIWITLFRKLFPLRLSTSIDQSQQWIVNGGITVFGGILIAGLFQNYMTDAEVGTMIWFIIGLTMSVTRKEMQHG